jgi:hypothetical protein
MHAIHCGLEKHYKSVRDFQTDLSHLEEVKPESYQPDENNFNRNGRTSLTATLIIIDILLAIIAFGIVTQSLHGR